jgi:hypothetical protein
LIIATPLQFAKQSKKTILFRYCSGKAKVAFHSSLENKKDTLEENSGGRAGRPERS